MAAKIKNKKNPNLKFSFSILFYTIYHYFSMFLLERFIGYSKPNCSLTLGLCVFVLQLNPNFLVWYSSLSVFSWLIFSCLSLNFYWFCLRVSCVYLTSCVMISSICGIALIDLESNINTLVVEIQFDSSKSLKDKRRMWKTLFK